MQAVSQASGTAVRNEMKWLRNGLDFYRRITPRFTFRDRRAEREALLLVRGTREGQADFQIDCREQVETNFISI